jgi:hypothetical protein
MLFHGLCGEAVRRGCAAGLYITTKTIDVPHGDASGEAMNRRSLGTMRRCGLCSLQKLRVHMYWRWRCAADYSLLNERTDVMVLCCVCPPRRLEAHRNLCRRNGGRRTPASST